MKRIPLIVAMLIAAALLCAPVLPQEATPETTPDQPTFSPQTPVTRNTDWTPTIRDFDGVEMVLVPAGCFMMGSSDEQLAPVYESCEETFDIAQCQEWFFVEQPAHEQCFDTPFWIDRYEVSNNQFIAFNGVADYNNPTLEGQCPRYQITWFEARAFCELRGARLPTESEWEYAARGPDTLLYPWGNAFLGENIAYGSGGGTYWMEKIGTHHGGVSWVGAEDMIGNIAEWTSSIFASYPYDPTDGREDATDRHSERVIRGGGWPITDIELFRAAMRGHYVPYRWGNADGFRCARSWDDTEG